ncbi:MAG TPA: 4-(cytidine 5'-diphospho)-2-C-methyl-D-erythritol kinase [Clostridia bacterium]
MKIYAYAKINLSLFLTGTKDNFHLLDSVMLTCKNLKDTIIIKKSKVDRIEFLGDQVDKIDADNNTVKKCLNLFRKNTNIYTPVYIKVIKRIPIMAGLGGSSADAAGVLRGLCKLFRVDINSPEILDAAKKTGSDVPYMLRSNAARVKGVGDQIEYIQNNSNLYTVIAMDSEVSTKSCFDTFDQLNIAYSDSVYNDNLVLALYKNDYDNIIKNIKNDLYAAAINVNPDILYTEQNLKKTEADIVSMTGSGGAFFGLTSKKSSMKKIYKALKGKSKYIFKTDIF